MCSLLEGLTVLMPVGAVLAATRLQHARGFRARKRERYPPERDAWARAHGPYTSPEMLGEGGARTCLHIHPGRLSIL